MMLTELAPFGKNRLNLKTKEFKGTKSEKLSGKNTHKKTLFTAVTQELLLIFIRAAFKNKIFKRCVLIYSKVVHLIFKNVWHRVELNISVNAVS